MLKSDVLLHTLLSFYVPSSSYLHWWLSEWRRVCDTRHMQLFHRVDGAEL